MDISWVYVFSCMSSRLADKAFGKAQILDFIKCRLPACLRIATGRAVVFGSLLGDKYLTLRLRIDGSGSKEKNVNQ
ncbi:hypothetical protein SAMN03080617_04283 [Algoriphagus alkaliphilus]|uniref:Uncharacterized protein n=1 Tax=Algoriphagus alkaliphilus TaxID=279824 RepID=A0A1G5ZQB7_9BACT|nr:hypothetical protein SAMN03080617_04283 [Algoriphagus alkaliphilus]